MTKKYLPKEIYHVKYILVLHAIKKILDRIELLSDEEIRLDLVSACQTLFYETEVMHEMYIIANKVSHANN